MFDDQRTEQPKFVVDDVRRILAEVVLHDAAPAAVAESRQCLEIVLGNAQVVDNEIRRQDIGDILEVKDGGGQLTRLNPSHDGEVLSRDVQKIPCRYIKSQ